MTDKFKANIKGDFSALPSPRKTLTSSKDLSRVLRWQQILRPFIDTYICADETQFQTRYFLKHEPL